jgi:hypothetical protein
VLNKNPKDPTFKNEEIYLGKYEENTSQTNNEDISLPFYLLFCYGQKKGQRCPEEEVPVLTRQVQEK